MRIELISKGYNEGNRLVSVIEKKLGKLDKYFPDDSAEAKVKLSTVSTDKFTMEITIRFSGLNSTSRSISSERVSTVKRPRARCRLIRPLTKTPPFPRTNSARSSKKSVSTFRL